MKPDRATVEAWAASRDRGLTMAPRGLDVDALLDDVIALLDKLEASEKNDARWRALCEMVREPGPELTAGDAALDALDDVRIEAAEEAIDAWIARKGKEAKP
jgi:hypothetical protein